MIGVQAATKAADAVENLQRMLREADSAGIHGDILVRVQLQHGKPVRISTAVEATGKCEVANGPSK